MDFEIGRYFKPARLGQLALLGCLAPAAQAADVTYKLGTSPSSFESHSIDAGVSFGSITSDKDSNKTRTPFRIDAGYYQASGQDSHLVQHNGSFRWSVTDKDSISLAGKQIDDDVLLIKGVTLSGSVNLNRFWQGQRLTSLNLGHSRLSYSGETRRRLAAAVLERFPDQNSISIGLTQGLPADLSLNLSYERYRYSNDPVELAAAIAVRFRRLNRAPPSQAYALAGFPVRSVGAGLTWEVSDDLSVDTYFSQTETVLDQKLRSLSLGLSYVYGAMTIGTTLTRSAATEVLGPRGRNVVLASSMNTYYEFRVSYSF